MKIVVIGGGSSYTPELITGFLERVDTLPLRELWLVDIDQSRLDVVGGFANRMVHRAGSPFRIHCSTDVETVLEDASYVITQLRVGGMEARRQDEYLGRRYGLIGQETTGVGGMAKALRTIPVILDIARKVEEAAPDALLLNFTNPAGLITQALSQYVPRVAAVGVCNDPITAKMRIIAGCRRRGWNIDPARAQLESVGLNHLTWHRSFTIDGEECWPRVMEELVADVSAFSGVAWDTDTLIQLGMLPNNYLQYYYYTEDRLNKQERWPPSRAEQVMEIEKQLLRRYAEPELDTPPAELMQRGGAYYSTAATQLINAHYNDLREVHTINVRQGNAVPAWPADWVLELPAEVGRSEIRPLPTKPLPSVAYGLLVQVKQYELLTVQAAVHKDYRAAYQALLAHPLGPPADNVKRVLADMLETNRSYLGEYH